MLSFNLIKENPRISFWKMNFLHPVENQEDSANIGESKRLADAGDDDSDDDQGMGMGTGEGRRARTDAIPNIVYLYKLARGVAGRSFGAKCAAMAGVPSCVLVRANQISQCIAKQVVP
jgi:hypothetical protein